MRLTMMFTMALLPAAAAGAQLAPRVEIAGGVATPARSGGAFAGAGYAARLTTIVARPAGRISFRADLAYSAPGHSSRASVDGGNGGDMTAFTVGGEWRPDAPTASAFQPYVALGLGAATGYYGNAVESSGGRASGGAIAIALGARRILRRATLGLEVGYAAYGPVGRTAVVPITLALGF